MNTTTFMFRPMQILLVAFSASLLAGQASGQVLSPLGFFPGDTQIDPSPQTQDWPQIAAGGPGFLVVWDDKRAVLEAGSTTPTGVMLQGNGYDIYGALLDPQGQIIKSPIVIANQGRNQNRPQVAWNGESFLVVWTSERPDWYFFQDIMAIRVSADGELLDPEPFVIRPHIDVPFQPNDYAENPCLTSDGNNWVVVWKGMIWVETRTGATIRHPNLAGTRIAPDGTILDPDPVVIYQPDPGPAGPNFPDIAFAGDELLVVWEENFGIWGRRVDFNLLPLGPRFLIKQSSTRPRIATDGTDFLIVDAQYRGFRVTHDGTVLDSSGIDFDTGGQMWQPSGPDVAWDGAKYTVAFGSGENSFSDSDLYVASIGADGTLNGPTIALQTDDSEWNAAVASAGGGTAQIALTASVSQNPVDIRTFQLAAEGSTGSTVDVGVGMHRQHYLRFASNGDEHLAVFTSDGNGQRRILAQRVNSSGVAIDTEPILLTTFNEFRVEVEPDVAFNGTHFLVTWTDFFGGIFGQRIAADGTLVDPVPVELIPGAGATGNVAIGALGDNFLIVYSVSFSGDQQAFQAARVQGGDLAVLDTPFYVANDYALDPRVTDFGDSWLLVWEDQTNHNQSSSVVKGRFISASGALGTSFNIGAGLGDDPDVAVSGDRALVVWWDTSIASNGSLKGRMINVDGSFATDQFLIADAAEDQRQPAVGWDGEQFVVAWMDFREVDGVEHERADIYAARVALDGTVIDPDGFAVTSTALPEELPDVAGFGGSAMIAFSMLHGETDPEIQRIGFRVLSTSGESLPQQLTITHGTYVSGGVIELSASDDADLSLQRATSDIQSRTEFEVKSVSPIANPGSLEVTLEASVFARSTVNQTIELFDYVAGAWEQVDTRPANRFSDATVTVAAIGDLSRFVEPETMFIEARIRYESISPRQRFSSNTDQFIWTIGQ